MSPDDRKAAMARVRAGQERRYLDRAQALADEHGLTPTAKQLRASAEAIRLADLADMRIKAFQALKTSA